jgi:solute carrier family 25 phosphate transporter 23/24/25/41
VTTRYSDGRGAARVDKDGDINVSFPRPPGSTSTSTALFGSKADKEKDQDQDDAEEDDFADTVDETAHVDHNEAWRFLLAGGVAGAGT